MTLHRDIEIKIKTKSKVLEMRLVVTANEGAPIDAAVILRESLNSHHCILRLTCTHLTLVMAQP